MTRIKIKLITHINMSPFHEKGIRGKITRVLRHYTERKNKYKYNYDKSKKSTYILSKDFNNIYVHALSQ